MVVLNNDLASYVPLLYSLTPGTSITFLCLNNPAISYTLFMFLDKTYLLSEFIRSGGTITEVSKKKFTSSGQRIDLDWEIV